MRVSIHPFLIAGLMAFGCQSGSSSPEARPDAGGGITDGGMPDTPPEVAYLSPTDHLIRASMALRGIRPSIAELEQVRTDPTALPDIVDGYLDSPQFGATMRDLHNEALLTRWSNLPFIATDELADAQTGHMQASLGEEPLRLVEHVVMNDRPYTEIVTADYTMADDVVATAYGLPYDADGPTWQVTHYKDGRPAAGVLSTTAFFIRHRSAGQNFNRGRANAVSKALLCTDFLDRDVVLDTSIDLSDPEVVANAVVENQACASCHQSLDPLASFMFGFKKNLIAAQIRKTGYPLVDFFNPDQVNRWKRTNHRSPGYFGLAGDSLSDLGQLIADDPRFSLCAADRFYSFFNQVDLADVPLGAAAHLQQLFIDSGYSAKALARAVVLSDAFRISHAKDEMSSYVVGIKKASPEQLSRMFFNLTGFRWVTVSNVNLRGGPVGRVDLLTDDTVGFSVLAGGLDSFFVTEPSHTTNATSSLVLRNLAANAAGFVVTADFDTADAGARHLLTLVGPKARDEARIRAQLVALFERLYGEFETADSEAIDQAYALFQSTLERTSSVPHAWKTTLTAMLQDLRIATY